MFSQSFLVLKYWRWEIESTSLYAVSQGVLVTLKATIQPVPNMFLWFPTQLVQDDYCQEPIEMATKVTTGTQSNYISQQGFWNADNCVDCVK